MHVTQRGVFAFVQFLQSFMGAASLLRKHHKLCSYSGSKSSPRKYNEYKAKPVMAVPAIGVTSCTPPPLA